ncbi:MAG: hypothetical protein P8R42_12425 [Candidatus Binatia bacterium]|nr:hypothetical protein [Candidatus Binatia bacterium]
MPPLTPRSLIAAAAAAVFLWAPRPAGAVDYLVGHRVSSSTYGNGAGKAFKIVIKAGQNGNAPAFVLPVDPGGGTNLVAIERDSALLADPLTAGTWKGLGNPAGSKGWKYTNSNAPGGGRVKLLLVKERVIKLVTKGTGDMGPPVAPNGSISVVLSLGDDSYCAEATPPHFKEIDGKLIRSKQQPAPAACADTCLPGSDTDNDRLDDCSETNTGVFNGAFDTGTDPLVDDTDNDGLRDGDEVLGTPGGLDLPAFGVSPLRQDILLEYDWFEDSLNCPAHSHEPSDAALAMVTAMFAAAPRANPDGSTGINFIHDKGQGGVLTGGSMIPDADGVLVGDSGGAEFQSHKAANFAANREDYFHYTVLPHRYNTSSGSSGHAELGGDDLIVSLQCFLSDSNVGHTIAHELGHNLLLFHGGFNDLCNYKPNYNSVMNYRYQFPGVDSNCTPPGDGVLDYSIGDRISLDETNLDENDGTCGPGFPWDWNGNGPIETGVVFDINPDSDPLHEPFCGGALSTLNDADDWANIRLDRVVDGDGAIPRSARPSIACDNPAPAP